MNIAIVSVVTLAVNLLLGRYRIRYRKMSLMWWVIIHASLPLVIPLRICLDTPDMTIPLFMGLAILGQLVGSRIQWGQSKG